MGSVAAMATGWVGGIGGSRGREGRGISTLCFPRFHRVNPDSSPAVPRGAVVGTVVGVGGKGPRRTRGKARWIVVWLRWCYRVRIPGEPALAQRGSLSVCGATVVSLGRRVRLSGGGTAILG